MPVSIQATPNKESAPGESKAAVLPRMIGGYDILEEIGRGGMGVVYKAQDQRLKRTVALKMVWGGSSASPEELARFRGEAEVVAQLQHPNIVQIYEIGMHEGQPFIVFEFIDGGNLADRIMGKPQPPRQAAEMVNTLARAMHAAHQLHIIHRDLKPANVLLTKSGTLKLTDFGLAKQMGNSLGLSRTGDVMGTPSYMAPEQAAGQLENLGPKTDVYALGAILYEMLTGRPPFRGVTMFETLEQVRSAEPVPLSKLAPRIHKDLSTVCLKCLQKTPEKRYASALELADDLRRWLDGDSIHARPVSAWEKFWRQVRRHPWQYASFLACGLMVAALTLLGLMYREKDHQERIRDQQARYSRELQAKSVELQKQYDLTLSSMERIRGLVKEGGPLSMQGGLDPLYEQLLAFYQKLIEQQEGNQYANLRQLAEACYNLGELISRGGRSEEAVKAFAKARSLYDRLLPTESTLEQQYFRHRIALTFLKTGRLYQNRNQIEAAKTDYGKAHELFQALHKDVPTKYEYARDLAEAWHCQGELLAYNERKYAEGLQHYREARRLRQSLGGLLPAGDDKASREHQRDLARSFGYEGDAYLDLYNYKDADAAYWASHRLREALAKDDPIDPETRFQLARSFGNFGNYQARIRSPQTALHFHQQACKLQEELAAENRAVLEYQSDLLGTYNRLIELHINAMTEAEDAERKLLQEQLDQVIQKTETHLALLDVGWIKVKDRKQIPGVATGADENGRKKSSSEVSVLPLRSLQRNVAETHLFLAQYHSDTEADLALQHRLRASKHLIAMKPREKTPAEAEKVDPYLAYLEAMSLAQRYESQRKREGTNADDKAAVNAVNSLRLALTNQYRRKHPRDIEQDRPFKSLRERKDFQELVQEFARLQVEAEARVKVGA